MGKQTTRRRVLWWLSGLIPVSGCVAKEEPVKTDTPANIVEKEYPKFNLWLNKGDVDAFDVLRVKFENIELVDADGETVAINTGREYNLPELSSPDRRIVNGVTIPPGTYAAIRFQANVKEAVLSGGDSVDIEGSKLSGSFEDVTLQDDTFSRLIVSIRMGAIDDGSGWKLAIERVGAVKKGGVSG